MGGGGLEGRCIDRAYSADGAVHGTIHTWMGGGLYSRCVGHVYSRDGAVLQLNI